MGKTNLPSSDFDKVVLGKRALEQLMPMMAPNPGKPPGETNSSEDIQDKTPVAALSDLIDVSPRFITRFKEGIDTFSDLVSQEMVAVREKRKDAEILSTMLLYLSLMVRDSWSGIRRRARREKLANTYLVCYKMPLEKDRKVKGTSRGWIEMSEVLELGDAEAVKEGFPSISNPTVVEVGVARNKTQVGANAADQSQLVHKGIQEQLFEQRIVVDDLIREFGAILRNGLRNKPDGLRRDIMRTFGFSFDGQPAPRPVVSEETGNSLELFSPQPQTT